MMVDGDKNYIALHRVITLNWQNQIRCTLKLIQKGEYRLS